MSGLIIEKTVSVPLTPSYRGGGSDVGRTPTSVIIEQLLASAPSGQAITLEWLFASLRQRSFGLVMLVLGLMAILPGICAPAGLVLVVLSAQMLMGRDVPALPQFMVSRPLPHARFVWLVKRLLPLIKSLERFISPRWQTPPHVKRQSVGVGLLLMAVALFIPVPFSNVVPGVVITLLALAYLEDDGLLLTLALVASLISFLEVLAAAWETTRGAFFLSHI